MRKYTIFQTRVMRVLNPVLPTYLPIFRSSRSRQCFGFAKCHLCDGPAQVSRHHLYLHSMYYLPYAFPGSHPFKRRGANGIQTVTDIIITLRVGTPPSTVYSRSIPPLYLRHNNNNVTVITQTYRRGFFSG